MKKQEYLYVVVYKGDNNNSKSLEAILYKKADFTKWLKEHNKQRINNGDIPENKQEFNLEKVYFYNHISN